MAVVAFDTETKGLDWFDPAQQAFLASWADADGEYHADLGDPAQAQQFTDALKSASALVCHNLSFDTHQVRETLGLDVTKLGVPLHDTALMAPIHLPSGQNRQSYRLKDLAAEFLDPEARQHEEHIDEMAQSMGISLKTTGGYYDVWRAYPEVMEKYARYDARFTYDLYMMFGERMTPAEVRCYELEQQVALILIEAERKGVAIDPAPVNRLKEDYEARVVELHAQLVDTFGETALGGKGSEQALLDALEEMGVKLYRRTKTGKLQTSVFALQEFYPEFPILESFSEFRTANKFLSTYINPMVDREVVHASFSQLGAWTSRMSCRRPNMQNIPVRAGAEVREMFVPRPGHAFVVSDFDSIEVRLLAHYLGDADFRQLIDDGHDPHAWMAAQIHGGSPEDYSKDGPNAKIRGAAKNTLFAITYGAGAPRVADMNQISKDQAKALIAKIKSSLPNYRQLNKRIRDKIEAVGHVNTVMGRTQVVSPDKAYVGLNALIQGSAAEIMKLALVAVARDLGPLGGTPLLVVHDEVVTEVPIENVEQAKEIQEAAMCGAYELKPRLAVSTSVVTDNYASAK